MAKSKRQLSHRDSNFKQFKKRTYEKVKEEQENLREEVQKLEAQLSFLKRHLAMPGATKNREEQQLKQTNEQLWEAVKKQQLSLIYLQSFIKNSAPLAPFHLSLTCPMDTLIHLPKNINKRRVLLNELHPRKIQLAQDFLRQTFLFVDCTRTTYRVQEVNHDQRGYVFASHTSLEKFSHQKIPQVFEAVCEFIENIEISVSVQLGEITVREDYESIENRVHHFRVITQLEAPMEKFKQESNECVFLQLDGEKRALLHIDFVNQDDLYPYVPTERIRRDITGAIELSMYKNEETGEEGVLMRRAFFARVHLPSQKRSDIFKIESRNGETSCTKRSLKD